MPGNLTKGEAMYSVTEIKENMDGRHTAYIGFLRTVFG